VRAAVGDVELDYEVAGEGPDLVWLHGLSGSLDESRPLCERLSRRFRVLWYSTRGHGRSTPVVERHRYTYDVIADDLAGMLDHVSATCGGFDRPVLAGGSHGANTILRHELRHPGRASAMLLVAPGANALRRPRRAHWALVRTQMRIAARRGEDGIVKAITGHDPRDDAADQAAIAAARTHDFGSLLAAMNHIADQQVVPPAVLARIDIPALVAAWPRDPLIHPIAVARRVAQLIPDAEFEEIPRAADLTPDQAADMVGAFTDRLLARVAARPGARPGS
jgi:pimeloyl-ACP methyl ester carboxylesterase